MIEWKYLFIKQMVAYDELRESYVESLQRLAAERDRNLETQAQRNEQFNELLAACDAWLEWCDKVVTEVHYIEALNMTRSAVSRVRGTSQ